LSLLERLVYSEYGFMIDINIKLREGRKAQEIMEIKLDSEAAASIASAAIFESLSQQAREDVVKQAIASLLVPKTERGYGSGKTPLQLAFENAISNAAYRVVDDKIKNDPDVTAHIEELLGPLINSAIKAEAEDYSRSIADVVGQALGTWLYEKARG
jgi:hypothetical protein